MHRFTHSYEALLSTHFNIILPTALRRRIRNKTTHLFFPRLTLSWQALIIFGIFIIETKLDFVSFNDKHLQKRRKFFCPTWLSHTKPCLCPWPPPSVNHNIWLQTVFYFSFESQEQAWARFSAHACSVSNVTFSRTARGPKWGTKKDDRSRDHSVDSTWIT